MLKKVLIVHLAKFSSRPFTQTPHGGFYRVLGISASATAKQIKQSYYEKAKIYHPDISKQPNATSIFSQISKAYEILSDIQRKVEYDRDLKNGAQWTSNGYKASPKQQASSMHKGFQQYKSSKKRKAKGQAEDYEPFQNFDSYFGRNKHHFKAKKGQDIHLNLTITLKESVSGIKRPLKFTKKTYCPDCSVKVFQSCFSCGGKGTIFNREQRQKQQCAQCNGVGFKHECQTCDGERELYKDISEQIFIQKNTHNRSILRVQGRGHQGFRHDNGDLYITVLVQESEQMKVDGNNIHSQHSVDYLTAIFGGQTEIETIRGKHIFQVQPGTQSGKSVRLFNMGLVSQFSKRRGDQIVQFRIKVPEQINERQKKLLSELLRSQTSKSSI